MARCTLILLFCHIAAAQTSEARAADLDRKCEQQYSMGDHHGALDCARLALSAWEEISRLHPVNLAPCHHRLALIYLAQGKLSAAMKEVDAARRLAAPSDRGRITRVAASIHFAEHEYEKAESEFSAALDGASGADRATLLSDLGMVAAARGRLVEARRLLEESRAVPAGSASWDRGRVTANLALICFRLGDLSAAAALYPQAIQSMEDASGPQHADLGVALAEYGQVLRRIGSKSEAKSVERRARSILANAAAAPDRWTVDVRSFRP